MAQKITNLEQRLSGNLDDLTAREVKVVLKAASKLKKEDPIT